MGILGMGFCWGAKASQAKTKHHPNGDFTPEMFGKQFDPSNHHFSGANC